MTPRNFAASRPTRFWLSTVWQLYRTPREFAAASGKAWHILHQSGIAGLSRAVRRKMADPVQPIANLLADASSGPALTFQELVRWPGQGLSLTHSVTIVIPTRGNTHLLADCLASLRRSLPAASLLDIVVVNNGAPLGTLPDLPWPVSIRPETRPFNWSAYNNSAVQDAGTEFALFLNDDIQALHTGWLDALLAAALEPAVGAVGAKLLYPDGTIQHCGIYLTPAGQPYHADRHRHRNTFPATEPREVPAVTGACLLTPLRQLRALNGFDERFRVTYNDLDYCLRLRDAGQRILIQPSAELLHLESATRPLRVAAAEEHLLRTRWPHP